MVKSSLWESPWKSKLAELAKFHVCSGYFKIRFSNFFCGLRTLKVELTQVNFKYWVIFIWHILVPKFRLEVKNVRRNKLNTSED